MNKYIEYVIGYAGNRVYTSRCGEGVVDLLFIHGLGDNCAVWDCVLPLMPQLTESVCVDLRGHGHSDWVEPPSYKVIDYVRDLEVLFARASNPIVLIGHSLGGEIALHLAVLHPKRVVGLVLVDYGPGIHGALGRAVKEQIALGTKQYGSLDDYLKWMLTHRPLASSIALEPVVRHGVKEVAPGAFIPRSDPSLAKLDRVGKSQSEIWSLLSQVTTKTLIIRGIASAALPNDVAESMALKLENGRHVTIARSGHAVHTDAPESVGRAIAGFVQETALKCRVTSNQD